MSKIKIAVRIKEPVDKKNILEMSSIRDRFTSDAYFRTSNSLINKINQHFGWSKGSIPIKNYEKHFTDIINFIINTYSIYTKEALSAKYSAMICPLKIIEYDGPLMNMREQLDSATIPDRNSSDNSMSWSDILMVLDQNFNKSKHPGGKIVAAAYKNKYLLSIADMVNTRVDPDGEHDMDHNYLDLDNHIWYIRGDINKHKQSQNIDVSEQFIQIVKELLRKGSKWLISKKGGQPYKTAVALKHLDLSGFTINQLRNAAYN